MKTRSVFDLWMKGNQAPQIWKNKCQCFSCSFSAFQGQARNYRNMQIELWKMRVWRIYGVEQSCRRRKSSQGGAPKCQNPLPICVPLGKWPRSGCSDTWLLTPGSLPCCKASKEQPKQRSPGSPLPIGECEGLELHPPIEP